MIRSTYVHDVRQGGKSQSRLNEGKVDPVGRDANNQNIPWLQDEWQDLKVPINLSTPPEILSIDSNGRGIPWEWPKSEKMINRDFSFIRLLSQVPPL